jgi:hypothetical protein
MTSTSNDEFVSYSQTFFRESEQVMLWLSQLRTDASVAESIERVILKYQEQPHLLDSHLSLIIDTLFDKSHNAPPRALSPAAWRIAYTLMRVRGAKVVWKFLPHDVLLLVPLIEFVESDDRRGDDDCWQARFVALYWLAVLVLVPFRFGVFAESTVDIDARLRAILQLRLADAGPTRDAAAFLAAQWVARGDAVASMTEFLNWCIDRVVDFAADEHLRCGVLRALANVCRFAPRTIVAGIADRLLSVTLAANETASDSQRLLLKVIQRVTLALVPVTSTARSDGGTRVRRLFASAPADEDTASSSSRTAATAASSSSSSSSVVEAELPSQLEAVLDVLIRNVIGQTGGARWMAAKGIARICARLPAQLVVEAAEAAVFLDDADAERPAALHGVCLLLAEMLRRGVLPASLRERALCEIAARGVVCDQRRAAASIGSAARDAAAYAMWAAARAIPQSAMAPLLADVIAPSMVVMAVCDREVNCRRAAAAALQENIGRHGSFPNGIAIVTLLDFHAVGSAATCFRVLLPQLAAMSVSFFDSLLAHLVERTSRHWHVEQRTLCADALGLLAKLRPDAVLARAVPPLVERTRKAADYVDRHGALLALASICSAVAGDAQPALPAGIATVHATPEQATALMTQCETLPGECGHPAAMRAPGAPQVVGAAARLAGSLAALDGRCAARVIDEIRRSELVSVARLALSSDDAECRAAGAAAVERLVQAASGNERAEIARSFVEQLENKRTTLFAQCGACQALGVLPDACFVVDSACDIALVLRSVSAFTTLERADCSVRAQACTTLESLLSRHFHTRTQVVDGDALVAECLSALRRATLDRTVDAHGDVGAQVREAALSALTVFAKRWLADDSATLGDAVLAEVRQFATALPEHCFDRINRGRAAACVHFSELAVLHSTPLPSTEPAVAAIVAATPTTDGWIAVSVAVPLFVPLLSCEVLAPAALRGIATALDGATRSLAEQVHSTTVAYVATLDNDKLIALCSAVRAAVAGPLDARTRPAFWQLATLVLGSARADADRAPVAALSDALSSNVISEYGRARTFANARGSLPVLVACAEHAGSGTPAQRRSLQQLLIFLACSWPVVRRETAELLVAAQFLSARADALALLRGTAWDDETLERVRDVRNELCAIVGVPAPVATTSKK